MGNKSPKAVGNALQTITQGDDQQELTYDPRSGALEVVRKGGVVRDVDRVPATEMAREGFFR